MFFTTCRYALALALVLLIVTPLLSGCGGGDEADDCPTHAAAPEGKKTIPAEPCGDSTK